MKIPTCRFSAMTRAEVLTRSSSQKASGARVHLMGILRKHGWDPKAIAEIMRRHRSGMTR